MKCGKNNNKLQLAKVCLEMRPPKLDDIQANRMEYALALVTPICVCICMQHTHTYEYVYIPKKRLYISEYVR